MYYDVSLLYSPEMVIYPGDPPFQTTEIMKIEMGDVGNLSAVCFGSHTGTHIDAPKHFFDNGLTVDQISLDYFIGTARVCEIVGKEIITETDLQRLGIQKNEIILLKTRNSWFITQNEFNPDYTYLAPEAARYFVKAGIRTLGFDYFSVEKYSSQDFEVHRVLLGNQIIIIEGLSLGAIQPGEYRMIGLPLNIKNGNGSPIRVLLEDVEI
jgi:arylformamidase